MSQQAERPARPPRGPRPAADEGQDPVDYRPSQPQPTRTTTTDATEGKDTRSVPAAAPTALVSTGPQLAQAPRGREQTVQLATRVSPEIAALIDKASSRTGQSKRQVIEEAIRQAWQ